MKNSRKWIVIFKILYSPTIFVSVIDVISIQKTGEHFRLIYDVKGRFTIHRITPEEAKVISSSTIYYCELHLIKKLFLIIVQVM